MQKALLILLVIVLTSCGKFEFCHKEEKCPTVSQQQVPTTVANDFSTRYPNTTPNAWFEKKGNGHCAFFESGNQMMLVNYDKQGRFINEESFTANHENMHKNDGCICEI